ncbi:MAG: hypothetical protein EOP67_56155, partial [Sphingomonas sp.]
ARSTHLVKAHACPQQPLSVRNIAGMHDADVGCLPSVGQHRHVDLAPGIFLERRRARIGRYEIGRHDLEPPLGRAERLPQRLRQRLVLVGGPQRLLRRIADQDRARPDEVERAARHRRDDRPLRDRREVVDRVARPFRRTCLCSEVVQTADLRRGQDEGRRVGGRGVPIGIEGTRRSRHHRPHAQHIQVGEIVGVAGAEILVADVAPADDRRRAVRGEALVVHASVETQEIGRVPYRLGTTHDERVVEPHFDGRRILATGSGSGTGTGAGTAIRSSGSTLHAKAFAVDGRRIFIGSFNFDPRSMHLNTEMGFVLHSPILARRLEIAFADQIPRRSYEVILAPNGRLRWIERGAGGLRRIHDSEPGLRWWHAAGLRVLTALPIEWML